MLVPNSWFTVLSFLYEEEDREKAKSVGTGNGQPGVKCCLLPTSWVILGKLLNFS